MRRFSIGNVHRFGYSAPHSLNNFIGYRGGVRL